MNCPPLPENSVVAKRVAARKRLQETQHLTPAARKQAPPLVPGWAIAAIMFLVLYGLAKLAFAFPVLFLVFGVAGTGVMMVKGKGPLSLYSSTANAVQRRNVR